MAGRWIGGAGPGGAHRKPGGTESLAPPGHGATFGAPPGGDGKGRPTAPGHPANTVRRVLLRVARFGETTPVPAEGSSTMSAGVIAAAVLAASPSIIGVLNC